MYPKVEVSSKLINQKNIDQAITRLIDRNLANESIKSNDELLFNRIFD